MSAPDSSDLSVSTLLALRQEPDAVRIITERLKVKEMGPADHIRTKHEVKVFVDAPGTALAAEELLKRAQSRRTLNQTNTIKVTRTRGQRMTD